MIYLNFVPKITITAMPNTELCLRPATDDDKKTLQPSKFEKLPREIRNIIYSFLGLETRVTDAGLGIPFQARHVFVAAKGELHLMPAWSGDEVLGFVGVNEDGEISPKDFVGIMATSKMMKAEVEELLYEHAVLLLELEAEAYVATFAHLVFSD